ncbi:cadherin-7-like isoform X1 [Polyodon spathula]|uniref:cadherin-7-like isoform X1 n=1 Tax=Polyodon spathula TaxID=7913 RepID=UPI001B7E1CD8|nr:cadherin-7-like isoform X1 [Polyodon spathula]XP_041103125.1 cadherin-7-like isoform X1 [Polyodon spathula]
MNCYAWLPILIAFSVLRHCFPKETNSRKHLQIKKLSQQEQHVPHRRIRRGWKWNQLFVPEEDPGPLCVGQLKSDDDKGNFSIKYILLGEGAGEVFRIDEDTGFIYTMKKLDREEKAFYTMRAQAINRLTMEPVEPESEFIIKVQDINDNKPQFQNGPYVASIPEMCEVETSVIQVTATDADDPTHGNSARLIYSILQGQPYFSIEPKTGIIFTSLPDMDREAKEQHLVIIQVKDMVGQQGGFSATTTVTVNLADINDNGPQFQQKLYHFSVPESATIGTMIGRIMADDSDIGENAEMNYTIEEIDSSDVFDIMTDSDTQEGILILNKHLDYESKRRFSIRAVAINKHIDPQIVNLNQFKDLTDIKITVEDVDEPPVFSALEYMLEILENSITGTFVGAVTARDQDVANNPIRYHIDQNTDLKRMFKIAAHNGTITLAKPLDRETASWHNLTVSASEEKKNGFISRVPVFIRVIDINDNAPEFSKRYTPYVCETAKPGELIQTISATDKDDPVEGHHFYFTLATKTSVNTNFTVRDNQDNTAGVLTRKNAFSRQEQVYFHLPIVITDDGEPALSSTNTLTIRVCDCYPDGSCSSGGVDAFALYVGISPGALIAILSCFLIILVLVLLILAVRRYKKEKVNSEKWEEVTENVVRYEDEGGEQDTEAFDVVTLRSHTKRKEPTPRNDMTARIRMSLRQSLRIGPDDDVFREFILERLHEADTDPCAPPYNSLQTYAFEGDGSVAGSLSSLESGSTDTDENYEYLSNWGPRFQRLASIYENDVKDRDF